MPIIGSYVDIIFSEDPETNWMGNNPIRALVALHVWEDSNQRVWMEWRTKYARKSFPIVMGSNEFRSLILFLGRKLGFVIEEMPIYKRLGKRGPWDHDTDYTKEMWQGSVFNGLTMQGYWEWVAERKLQENKY